MRLRGVLKSALPALGLVALTAACGGGQEAAKSLGSGATSNASSVVSTSAPSTASTPTSSAPAPGSAVDAKAFVSRMRSAIQQAKSYQILDERSTDVPTTGRIVNHGGGKVDFETVIPGDGTMRYVGGDAYFAPADNPDHWIKFSKTSSDPEVKATLASMQTHATDGGYSDLRIYEASKITFVGDESEGRHYKIVAPAEKFYDEEVDESATTEQGGPVNTAADKAKLAGKTITFDLWMDEKGLPFKVKTDSTSLTGIKFSVDPSAVVYRSTTRLTQWGEPMTIEVPPSHAVVPFESTGDTASA